MNIYIREPINALTHLGGAILSFVGLLAMIIKVCLTEPSITSITAIMIFGISMILLYTASATYHSVIGSDRVLFILRKLDHSMIYLLIAGSYTPFCLITLNNKIGWIIFLIVTVMAIAGITFKLAYFHCPRWLSTSIYIAMGWLIVFASNSLFSTLQSMGVLLLLIGGIFYSVGGVIYAIKPKFMSNRYFGFHEIFHIFILLGSLSHFLCVYFYVI